MRASSIAILVIFIAVLVFAGIYFFGAKDNQSANPSAQSNNSSENTPTNSALLNSQNGNDAETEDDGSVTPPEPSDDIDQIVDSLFADAQAEEERVQNTSEFDVLQEDAQAMEDLSQTYTVSDLP